MTKLIAFRRTLPALAAIVTVMAASSAMAGPYFGEANCMYKPALVQKGGEKTPTSIYDGSQTKTQWCSHTAYFDKNRNDNRMSNNRYNNEVSSERRAREGRMHNHGHRNNTMAPARGY